MEERVGCYDGRSMAKLKNHQTATRSDLKKVETTLSSEISGVKKDANVLKKDVKELKEDVGGLKHGFLDLKIDMREVKEEVRATTDEIKLLHKVIMRLDDRVRYQQDIPERVEQLEQDVYDLKRKIHNKAQV